MSITARGDVGDVELQQDRPDLVRYVSRLGVPKRVVEELTQDVLLVAHQRQATFRGQSALRTWLQGIALHLVLNWRRRRCNRERCDEHNVLETRVEPRWTQAESKSAFDAVWTNQLCARVARTLEDLPEATRRLWLLVTFDDVTVAAASRMLGLKEDQAHRRLQKTNLHIRNAIVNRTCDGALTEPPVTSKAKEEGLEPPS
jgi:RNA polymerase sigma-70 factor (ECF subfamily)